MGISAIADGEKDFLGFQGMHGHYASSLAMQNADLVIALGVRFNDRTTGNRAKFAPKAKFIHIDIDSSEFSKTVKSNVGIKGDIHEVLQKIIMSVENSKHSEWRTFIETQKSAEKAQSDKRDGMTPKNVLDVANKHKKDSTIVITDVGQHQMWAAQYLKYKKPHTFITSGGLGTMGFGLGAAIGASFACNERCLLVTGDGSFGMCLNELATAVSNELPITILILNNGVLGMVRQWQTLFFNKHYSNTILERKTNFVALAKAFGADGMSVDSLSSLDDALSQANKSKGPFVIDCAIDKDEMVLPMLPPGGSVDDIIVKIR